MDITKELEILISTSEHMDREVVPDYLISRLKSIVRKSSLGLCPLCGCQGSHFCVGKKDKGWENGDHFTKYIKHTTPNTNNIIIDNSTFSLDSLRK